MTHLPSDKMNENVTYADFMGFLIMIYNSLYACHDYSEEFLGFFQSIHESLCSICLHVYGDQIQFDNSPLIKDQTMPEVWVKKDVGLYHLIIFIDYFWNLFKIPKDPRKAEVINIMAIYERIGKIAKRLELADDIKVIFEGGPNLSFGTVLDSQLIFLPLADILERKKLLQNKNAQALISGELTKVYENAVEHFGFGLATAMFMEAGKISEKIQKGFTLIQWQVIYKAAPENTKTSMVALENIVKIKKEQE